MKSIILYLHAHQPLRINEYTIFNTGVDHSYFSNENSYNEKSNQFILNKVADKSYLPTNNILLDLLKNHPQFKLSLSITGTLLEQLELWRPDVLKSFQDLVATNRVDIAAETYYHSLAFFYSRSEFELQVTRHAEKVYQLFGVKPTVFRNTELAYNNELARWAEQAGYDGIIAEGWDPILGWRSPNFMYRPAHTERIKLLLKNYSLSDDIAFRFWDKGWEGWPLTADKFCHWLNESGEATNFNLFMDYETFGEHQWESTGIFKFLEKMPSEWLKQENNTFLTLTEATKSLEPVDYVDMPYTVTWADTERDLSAWTGNSMQQEALKAIYSLEDKVLMSGDRALVNDWRLLQTSDHFYYMCTKWFNDGDIHAYFSPYETPYDAFINFMNAWHDLRFRLIEKGITI